MSDPTFADVFKRRLLQVKADAQACGMNLTVLCKEAGISRATPDRWMRAAPKTVKLIDDMEKIVAQKRAQPQQ